MYKEKEIINKNMIIYSFFNCVLELNKIITLIFKIDNNYNNE